MPIAPPGIHTMTWQTLPENLSAPCGRFAGAIADLDTARWDTGLRRRLARKAWVFAGVHTERFAMGFALVDAGLVASAFVYVYDRYTQQLTERKLLRPLGFAADFAPTPHCSWHLQQGGQCYRWFKQPDAAVYVAEYHGQGLSLTLHLADNGHSISALNRTPHSPCQYTEKNIGLITQAACTLNNEQHQLSSPHGVFDFSLGYPPRHAQWQWASLSGHTDDGRHIGINAVAQYFNGLENTLWLANGQGNSRPTPLPQMLFDYNHHDVLQPWSIRSADGCLNICFIPEGLRQENINLGLLASQFQQPFGRFTGSYTEPDGQCHAIRGLGVVEQHRAVW